MTWRRCVCGAQTTDQSPTGEAVGSGNAPVAVGTSLLSVLTASRVINWAHGLGSAVGETGGVRLKAQRNG